MWWSGNQPLAFLPSKSKGGYGVHQLLWCPCGQYFPQFSEFALLNGEESPLSNKFGATAEAILTEFKTTEDIVNDPLEELVGFVAATGCDRFSDPDQVTKLLQKAARDSYRLDKVLYEPITTSIACSFNCIRAFEKEQKALDKAIAETAAGLNPTEYQILKSIPGIGPVYAAGIFVLPFFSVFK